MRLLISLAAGLVAATAASAEPQDRYGPPRPAKERALELAALRGYQGPVLSWTNKRTARPEPAQAAATPATLPEFAPTPVHAERPAPVSPPPLRVAHAAPAPTRPAAPATQPPAPTAAGAGPRYYSVHREFGLAPDAIPEQPAQPRYVLVGPPDRAAEDDAPKTAPNSRAF